MEKISLLACTQLCVYFRIISGVCLVSKVEVDKLNIINFLIPVILLDSLFKKHAIAKTAQVIKS